MHSIWNMGQGGTTHVCRVGVCTHGSRTTHSIWSIWGNGYVQSIWSTRESVDVDPYGIWGSRWMYIWGLCLEGSGFVPSTWNI